MEGNLTSACQLLSLFRNKDALGISDFAVLHEERKVLKEIKCAAGQPNGSLSAWVLLISLHGNLLCYLEHRSHWFDFYEPSSP